MSNGWFDELPSLNTMRPDTDRPASAWISGFKKTDYRLAAGAKNTVVGRCVNQCHSRWLCSGVGAHRDFDPPVAAVGWIPPHDPQ